MPLITIALHDTRCKRSKSGIGFEKLRGGKLLPCGGVVQQPPLSRAALQCLYGRGVLLLERRRGMPHLAELKKRRLNAEAMGAASVDMPRKLTRLSAVPVAMPTGKRHIADGSAALHISDGVLARGVRSPKQDNTWLDLLPPQQYRRLDFNRIHCCDNTLLDRLPPQQYRRLDCNRIDCYIF